VPFHLDLDQRVERDVVYVLHGRFWLGDAWMRERRRDRVLRLEGCYILGLREGVRGGKMKRWRGGEEVRVERVERDEDGDEEVKKRSDDREEDVISCYDGDDMI